MSPVTIGAAVVGGMLAGGGAWLVCLSLARSAVDAPTDRQRYRSRLLSFRSLSKSSGRIVIAAIAAVLVWLVTGWPVAVLLAAAGGWWLPVVLGPDRPHREHVAGIEAVAAWAEMLRDLMAGASGLHQAIAATLPIAPEPIRADVANLAEQLRLGRPVDTALAEFADSVDNPTADLIAAALSAAAGRHAADLGSLLGSLAEAAREQSAMLVRVAANRARVRTATRIIIATTLGVAALLLLFSPDYLAPFDGLLGQFVLAVIGVVWATALIWLMRLSRPMVGPRVLALGPGKEDTA